MVVNRKEWGGALDAVQAWIDAGSLVTFVTIAQWTGKPHVRWIIVATPGQGDNVLNLRAGHYEMLGTQAVATEVPG